MTTPIPEEEVTETIKNIIYSNAHKSKAIAEEITEGQIIGLKTGPGQELEAAALGLTDYFKDLLSSQRQRVVELIENMIKQGRSIDLSEGDDIYDGYRLALQDVLTSLKDK